jgi:hydrogenase/urease accessory protein HupE
MRLILITATLWLLALSQGFSHSMMTAYLDMVEDADGSTSVSWRRPVFPGTMVTLEPIFPVDVVRVSSEPVSDEGTFSRDRYIVRGAARLWSDAVIGVKGEAPSGLEVLIRLELANGQKHVAVLRNRSDQFVVPKQPSLWQAALSYFRLGLDHILMGMDHLLFVLGLLILVPNRGMLVKTITAFTIAHSITLGIATLGYASAPLPPLNVAIALSIFFLGPEIIRMQRGETSLTIQHPWVVAFAFGLLHGFGFASGLTSLGLPREDVPFALLMFNLGVEFGQLCFVLLILLLVRSFRLLRIEWPRWVAALPCYTLGGLGAFWTIQRSYLLWQALR